MKLLLKAQLIYLVFLSQFLNAQYCATKVFDSRAGLEGNSFFPIFQDSKLNIWVGTHSHGVFRFTDNILKNVISPGEMVNTGIASIFEDAEGGIWFLGQNCFERYFKGKTTYYYLNKDLPSAGELKYDYFLKKPIFITPKPHFKIFHFDYSTKSFKEFSDKLIPNNLIKTTETLTLATNMGHSSNTLIILKDYTHKTARIIIKTNGTWVILNHDKKFDFFRNSILGNLSEGFFYNQFVMVNRDGLHSLESGKFKKLKNPYIVKYGESDLIEANKLKILEHNHQKGEIYSIWSVKSCDENKYMLAVLDVKTNLWTQTLLFESNSTPKHIIKDFAGTFWFTTYNSVVRIYPWLTTIPNTLQGFPKETWSISQSGNGKIWVASYGYGLASFDGMKFHPQPEGMGRNVKYANGSSRDDDGNIYFNIENLNQEHVNSGVLKFDGDKKWEILTENKFGFYFYRDRNKNLVRGMCESGIWILPKGRDGKSSNNWLKIGKEDGFLLGNVLTVSQDSYGRYWMGRTSTGIAMYDPNKKRLINWLKRKKPQNIGAISSDVDFKGNLWWGTDKGLIFMNTNTDINDKTDLEKLISRIGKNEVGASLVSVCKVYKDSLLIIGNQSGVYVLDLKAFYEKPQRQIIRCITKDVDFQLGGIEQNGIWIDEDKRIWIVGNNGLIRFDPNLYPFDKITVDFRIDSLSIDKRLIHNNFKESIKLRQGGSHLINIFLKCKPDSNQLNRTSIEYRFSDNEDWLTTVETNISLILSAKDLGIKNLYIRAKRDGFTSKAALITFEITVWWQNPIIWILIFSVLLVLVIYYKRKTKEIHKRELSFKENKLALEQMSKEKIKLQVQAIVNQLNPHFINNALQWLQVRVDNDEDAVKVVGKLSENISTVFKNSRNKKSYHSLQEELKIVENYLFIQKKRFGKRLDYEMPSNELIEENGNINVPLMIIQIHAENAVEHGIRNNQIGIGKVSIKLSSDEFFLNIWIEDDGIGRESARIIGSKGTQNGTKMLEELETIYNLQNELKLSHLYEDLPFVNAEGKLCGTIVKLRIPKNYSFEL